MSFLAHPVSEFDHLMIAYAADRAVIQLSTGGTARLIAWKPRRAGGHGRRMNRHCRVEFPGGARFTLPIRLVAGIVNQDGAVHYFGEDGHDQDLHDAGGRGAGGYQLPDARQLRDQRSDPPEVRGQSGQRPSPRADRAGSPGGDRGRWAAPHGDGDPQGFRGRSPVAPADRKGAEQ